MNQAAALERYRPVLAGTRHVDGGIAECGLAAITTPPKWLAKPVELGLLSGVASPALHSALDAAELVHAHFGPDAALLLRVLERRALADKPLVVTFHGYDATVTDDGMRALGRLAKHFVKVRRELFDRATVLVAVSEFIAERLVRAGADPRKVIVHYIGVDTSFFCAPTRAAVPPPRIVFLGRLHPKKGASDLLQALALLQSRGVVVACVVAGTGPEKVALRALAHDYALDIDFAGAFDASKARELLQNARVLCVPSQTAPNGDAEGFGLVFAEAQSCGVPVVSYRSGGVPEAVAHGETGFLAGEGDIDELADRLAMLLTDDEMWCAMSTAARAHAVERFDLRRQTAALEHIYDRARGL